MTYSTEEMQTQLFMKLKNYRIFDEKENTPASQSQQLRERVEVTYRAICSSVKHKGGKGEVEQSDSKKIANLKVTKTSFTNYLRKHYAARVAQKMSCILESQQNYSHEDFYTRVNDLLLKPKDPHNIENKRDLPHEEHKRLLKKFAFQMLDMNCDGMICETDLFTFLELHKDDDTFFKTTLIYDIQDIARAFNKRNYELILNNPVMDQTDPYLPTIKDLPAYLETTRHKAEHRREILATDFFHLCLNIFWGIERLDNYSDAQTR